HFNLWVTDGTSAGTRELTAAGAYSDGLFVNVGYPDFTILGTRALFAGRDASSLNLWVTDGTSAGTSELTVPGPSFGGLFGATSATGINPDFTAFGSKALFEAGNPVSLWVTDGTSAGTSELTVAGAPSFGLFYNGISPDFTVLGGKALFEGRDASNIPNLWVTNGTSAGTSELAVAGGYSGGLFSSVSNAGFTDFGSKAVFEGEEAATSISGAQTGPRRE